LNNSNLRKEDKGKGKPANISRVSLPIPSRLSKSVLAKSKFYKENQMMKPKSYTQALKGDINKIIKIKNAFSKLSSNKISEIYKIINNSDNKEKPKLNMMTKGSLQKQIIILMGLNVERVMT